MNISDSLDALRGKFSGCLTVAYADISTGMVLSASAQAHLNQEHLDALCTTASEMLAGGTARRFSAVLAGDQEEDIQQAIIFESSEVGLFYKSTSSPNEALCCACLPDIDLAEFSRQARTHFKALEAMFQDDDGS
ncbi:hypothetical protein N9M66_03275 [Litoreibacter sp.]|nr:hypothetical protein [Litoreibacter sp.]